MILFSSEIFVVLLLWLRHLLVTLLTAIVFKGQYHGNIWQEYVGKYVNPDISNILFSLYNIVNYQNQLVMFTSVGIHFQCETTDQTQ